MKKDILPVYRSFGIGLAIGLLCLLGVSLGFGILSATQVHVNSRTRTLLLAFLVLVSVFLVYYAVALLKKAVRFPYIPSAAAKARRKNIRIWFGVIVGSEVIAIRITSVMLDRAHRQDLISPLTVLIIGIHFLPLARLFEVRAYYFLGLGVSAVTLITLFATSASDTIAGTSSWNLIPCDTFVLLNWLTVGYLLIKTQPLFLPMPA